MKKINSSLPYWCDSSLSAIKMGTDVLFLPRIFSNNYPTDIKTLEMKRCFGTILVQCVIPSFYLLFACWSKAEEDELSSTRFDNRIRARFLQLLMQIFPQLFPYIFSTSAFFSPPNPHSTHSLWKYWLHRIKIATLQPVKQAPNHAIISQKTVWTVVKEKPLKLQAELNYGSVIYSWLLFRIFATLYFLLESCIYL